MDPQELVDEYRTQIDAASGQPKKTGLLFKGQRNNGNNMPSQANYYNRKRIEKSPPNIFKLVPFYALWIVLILVLIVYLVNRQGEIEQNQQDSSLLTLKQSTSTIASPKNVVASTAPVAVTGTQPSQSSTENDQAEQPAHVGPDLYKVTIKAKNHVWVEAKSVSSGESLFIGFLESGDTRDFTDKEGVRIRSGSAGNVVVIAGGKTTELGPVGKTAEKSFTNNKVSQLTEGQASENTVETADNKTVSATTNAAKNQTPNKKPTTDSTTAKKPGTDTTPAKKTALANSNSAAKAAHAVKENVPTHEAVSSTNEAGPKSIDVPYRYSEQ